MAQFRVDRFTSIVGFAFLATDVVFDDGIALTAAEMIIPKMMVPINTKNCL